MLALLPGFDGTGKLFAPLVDTLGDAAETLAIPYPDLTAPQDYVAHVADRLPVGRRVVLVAESFSGPIALALMASEPERVAGAVLSTTFARPPLGLVLSLAHKLRLSAFVRPAMNEQILRMFCLNGVADLALVRAIVDVVRPIGQATVAARLQALARMDATELLPTIRQPVLVLSARDDRVVRRRFSASLLAQLPDVSHEAIAGPHLLLQAAPSPSARAIRAFLEARCGAQ